MIPCPVVRYAPNKMVRQSHLLGDCMNRHSLVQIADAFRLFFVDFGGATFFAAKMMRAMLAPFQVFEIRGSVVEAVFVFVVNLVPVWAWANKGNRNKLMHVILAPFIVFEKPQVVVAAFDAKTFGFGVVRLGVTALGGDALRESPNVSGIADLVQAFVSRHIAPLFCGIMGLHKKFTFLVPKPRAIHGRRSAISIEFHHLARTRRVQWFRSILAQMGLYRNRVADLLEATA